MISRVYRSSPWLNAWLVGSMVLLGGPLAGVLVGLGHGPAALLIVGGSSIAMLSLLSPTWVVAVLYPALHVVGQVPIVSGPVPVSLERIVLLFGGLGLISQVMVRKWRLPRVPRALLLGWGIWLGAFLLSLIAHPSVAGVQQVFGYTQKAAFAWLTFVALSDIGRLRLALRLYVLAALAASVTTLYIFWTEGSAVVRFGTYNIEGTLVEQLLYGLARAGASGGMAAWIAWIEARRTSNRRQEQLWYLVMTWLLGISLLALRREFLVSIPICMLVAILYRPTGVQRWGIVLFILVAGLILGVVLGLPEWRVRLFQETALTLTEQRGEFRVSELVAAPQALLDAPLLGHGPAEFGRVMTTRYAHLMPEYILRGSDVPSSHNSFVTAAVEAGTIGLIGLVWALAATGRNLLKAKALHADGQLRDVLAFAPVLFVQALFWLFFGDGIILNVFWFWIGVFAAMIHLTDPQRAHVEAPAAGGGRLSPTRRGLVCIEANVQTCNHRA